MEKYIAYNYVSYKNKDNNIGFMKSYYCGYTNLKQFGIATINECKIEKAKRFTSKKELQDELKMIGRKISDYKIEKVSE